jgi:uncharacterized membrane protein
METTESALTASESREPRSDSLAESDEDRFHTAFVWTAAALVMAVLWIKPMVSSLWTDELGTWWVISGNAHQVVERAQAVQGQSPFYYLIAWIMRLLVGRSEFWLRFPSLVFLLAAAFLIYRIAERLIDGEAARIAVVTFAVWPSIAFAASDARPYALATLVAVASTWALISWLDSARFGRALLYVLLAASIPFVHPVFGLVLIPQAVYAGARIRERTTPVRTRDLLVAAISIGILTIPVVVELLALSRRQDDWIVPNTASVSWVTHMLVPPAFVGAALIGGLVASRRVRFGGQLRELPRSTVALLVGWLVIPTAFLVGLSIVSPIALLPARYFLCIAPAGVLLAALAIRVLEPSQVRRIIILLIVVFSVLDLAAPAKSGDMRGALALVRSVAGPQSVVLINAGFQESLQRDWYTDPERQGLLTAATAFYPVPGTIVPLPVDLNDSTLDFVRLQVANSIAQTDDVIVLTETGSSYGPWFDEYMAQRGWTGNHVGDVTLFTVTEFQRTPA